ncbi:MAG TPA: trehalose-phosphatase [Gemmatimonadaceae bacterium]|nr:trehalose-phosphatase [Gemmatimonadaceae bacterium]
MTEPLLPLDGETARRLAASPLVVLLDVDGTLAPIAGRPDQAVVPPETRRAVAALTVRSGVHVALVSGRAAADARRLVSVGNVWVIGNHGYEILGPAGEECVDAQLVPYRAAVAAAARRLEPRLRSVPGIFFEDKGWTLSVHYRLADAAVVPRVRGIVEEAALSLGLRTTEGKGVLEVRPPATIDKGTAVLTLAARLGLRRERGAAVFIGDDRTDEDAFRALRAWSASAVTVRVQEDAGAPPAATAAEFVVESPEDVRVFLEWLAAARP